LKDANSSFNLEDRLHFAVYKGLLLDYAHAEDIVLLGDRAINALHLLRLAPVHSALLLPLASAVEQAAECGLPEL
jgi:hypothetical protein